MNARERLRQGKFNSMNVECLPDSSQIITLHKEGDKKAHRFRVKNLYQPNEEEVDIDTGKPITKRNL